jgi:hypothetical protein
VESDAMRRFMASTEIGYDQWHDGVGYDLDALRSLTGAERDEAERWLIDRAGNDWRDLEGLLALGPCPGRDAVVRQLRGGKLEQRLWAARFLGVDAELAKQREDAVVEGLGSAKFFEGVSQALDIATEERTPAMIAALFRACLDSEGEVAVHAAARLAFIHGKAKEEFDWDLRPLFLRFSAPDRAGREAAFRDLCRLCKVDPEPYLRR